ncbi:unnamed protein product, partial [Prorocentrum cordatum]
GPRLAAERAEPRPPGGRRRRQRSLGRGGAAGGARQPVQHARRGGRRRGRQPRARRGRRERCRRPRGGVGGAPRRPSSHVDDYFAPASHSSPCETLEETSMSFTGGRSEPDRLEKIDLEDAW